MRRLWIVSGVSASMFALLLAGAANGVAPASADTSTVPWHGVVAITESQVTTDPENNTETQNASLRALITTTGAATISGGYSRNVQTNAVCPDPLDPPGPLKSAIATGSDSFDVPVQLTVSQDNSTQPATFTLLSGETAAPSAKDLTVNETDSFACGVTSNLSFTLPAQFGFLVALPQPVPATENMLSGTVSLSGNQVQELNLFGISLDGPTGGATINYQLSDVVDSDGDGCLDDYELAHGLDMFNPKDCTTVPPVFDPPPQPIEVTAPPGQTGAPVSYPPPPVHDSTGPIRPICTPASGSTFPIGTTDVTCSATGTGGTTTIQFPIIVDPPPPPPPPPPGGCGVGASGATASPDYTARIKIPVVQDQQIYDFSVGFSYCWTGSIAKVVHVSALGLVGTSDAVSALEVAGFTPTFDSSTQFLAGGDADATGTFSIQFAAGQFILNIGLGAAAEKLVLEELVPKLDLLISESAAGKKIDKFLTEAIAKIGKESYDSFRAASETLVSHLPGSLGTRIEKALSDTFLADVQAVEQLIDQAAEQLVDKGTSGDAIGQTIIQKFEDYFTSLTTLSFPTWTPTVSFHVAPNGKTTVSESGWANPFLTIARKS